MVIVGDHIGRPDQFEFRDDVAHVRVPRHGHVEIARLHLPHHGFEVTQLGVREDLQCHRALRRLFEFLLDFQRTLI